jgi:hypothetical protein
VSILFNACVHLRWWGHCLLRFHRRMTVRTVGAEYTGCADCDKFTWLRWRPKRRKP